MVGGLRMEWAWLADLAGESRIMKIRISARLETLALTVLAGVECGVMVGLLCGHLVSA
jgi:hypothetical protein